MSPEADDFKTLRRYSRQEAAAMLHTKDSWLRQWVTDDTIPHQRSGKPGPRQRGVWFTYDDILAIGKMMPSLMTPRQANSRSEGRADAASTEPDEQSSLEAGGAEATSSNTFSDHEWHVLSGLTSLRA